MSATGRAGAAGTGVVRHPDDFYATPAWCTRALLRALNLRSSFGDPDVILDPCCGDGAILDVVAAEHPGASRRGIEIDEDRARTAFRKIHEVVVADSLGSRAWGFSSAIVTNPPFALAREFVERSLSETVGPVVMLLRINWLASQKRAAFLRANTPSIYVLPKRPSFTGKGTDATEYAWFAWRDPNGPARVQILNIDGTAS